MPELAVDGLTMEWREDERLLRFVHGPGCVCSEANARRFAATMAQWVGTQPFAILVDASGAAQITREWRSIWAKAFSSYRDRVRIAIFQASPAGRLVIMLWSFAARVDVHTFPGETEARAWLAARRDGAHA